MTNVSTNKTELLGRYDMVLHLQSAAIGAEEFYTRANNSARRESVDEAKALDIQILRVWKEHPNLYVIANEKEKSFDDKMQAVCNVVMKHTST